MKFRGLFLPIFILTMLQFVTWHINKSLAQTSLLTTVKVTQLTQASNDSTLFKIVKTGSDTSKIISPATYTGILMKASGDSVDVYAKFLSGYSTRLTATDSVRVQGAGTHIYQLSIPVSRTLQVVFYGNPNNGSTTTIDSVLIFTQW